MQTLRNYDGCYEFKIDFVTPAGKITPFIIRLRNITVSQLKNMNLAQGQLEAFDKGAIEFSWGRSSKKSSRNKLLLPTGFARDIIKNMLGFCWDTLRMHKYL